MDMSAVPRDVWGGISGRVNASDYIGIFLSTTVIFLLACGSEVPCRWCSVFLYGSYVVSYRGYAVSALSWETLNTDWVSCSYLRKFTGRSGFFHFPGLGRFA